MKLNELVDVMNIAEVDVASRTIGALLPARSLDMRNLDVDPTIRSYGDREVESVTNICKLGITVWIK